VRPVEERPRTNPLSGLKVPAEEILPLGKAHPLLAHVEDRIDLLLHLGLRQVRSELDDVLVMSNRIGPVGSETLRILNSLPREALANCLRKSTWHAIRVRAKMLGLPKSLKHAFEPSLFEPKSPLPGNGIFRPETNGPKRRRSSRRGARANARR
jgi:hypothetical protein